MNDLEKVRFLVGGVQKGGTTALFSYLNGLAGIQMASVKETHFFDNEALDWTQPDHAAYHALFPPADARVRGEATPIYLYWPNCLERIARYNPDMRLIFIFRDPVERAWSHWKMEYARDWERQAFAWCIRDGRARVDSPEAPGHHRVFSYVERGFYGAQLERLFQVFPREQVLLLKSETLARRPGEVLAQVCRFVGAPAPRGRVRRRREWVAKDMDYGQAITPEDRAYLRDLYAPDLARFAALSGLSVDDWMADRPSRRLSAVRFWGRVGSSLKPA